MVSSSKSEVHSTPDSLTVCLSFLYFFLLQSGPSLEHTNHSTVPWQYNLPMSFLQKGTEVILWQETLQRSLFRLGRMFVFETSWVLVELDSKAFSKKTQLLSNKTSTVYTSPHGYLLAFLLCRWMGAISDWSLWLEDRESHSFRIPVVEYRLN